MPQKLFLAWWGFSSPNAVADTPDDDTSNGTQFPSALA